MDGPACIVNLRQAAGGGGGAEAVILDCARLLDPERFWVRTAYLRKHADDVSSIGRRFAAHGLDWQEFPGARGADPRQLLRVAAFLRRSRARILHCHESKADVYGPLLRRLVPGLRLAATLHAWHVHSWRSRVYHALDRLALRRYDLLVAVSEQTRQQALGLGLRNVELIRNGVDTVRWRPRPRRAGGPPAVGFAARLSREKGCLDFVRIAARVAARVPDCRFLVAGEGPERDAMQALARELGVAPRLRFLGLLDMEGVMDLFAGLDALVQPSHSEGLPRTLLEAAAMAVPLVATRAGGVAELLEHDRTGLLAEPGDEAALAEHLLFLLTDPERAAALGRAARQRVERDFRLRDGVLRLEALYQSLLPGAAPPRERAA